MCRSASLQKGRCVGQPQPKIYKWIRGTAAVWDLAILSDEGYALSPDQAAQAELSAWSKLWQPGTTTFPNKTTSQSSWSTGDLRSVINHCPLGKARGVDRWSIAELRLLPDMAIADLATIFKMVETTLSGTWPQAIKEMLYLQLPKEGARDAGERRPIALLPQVYRLWCALCTTLEPGGPGVPAAAKSQSAEEPLTRPLT
eukprot:4665830-Amphidinium_carterae.2